MYRWLTLCAVALLAASPAAAGVAGKYVEARTCDVWTSPCFANAEMNLSGKKALMAWSIDKGTVDGVKLDGLGVVAVVAASDTLGMKQTGSAKAVLLLDAKADAAQRAALVKLAKRQGGDLLKNVVHVDTAAIDLNVCDCKGGACATLKAGTAATIETRCLDGRHDKACGNDYAFYPPLSKGVHAKAAVAVQHGYRGKGFNETWKETDRRGAYVGSFEAN